GNAARGERGMHDAGALPDFHVGAASLLFNIVAEVQIRQKEYRPVGRDRVYHLDGIARGAEYVAFRFHLDRGIDVTDDDVIGVLAAEVANRFHRTAFLQTATGLPVRHDHDAIWVQHLGRFGHE